MFSDEFGNNIIMLKAHSISTTCQELDISYVPSQDLLNSDSHSSHGYSNQFQAETGFAWSTLRKLCASMHVQLWCQGVNARETAHDL